MFTVVDDEMLEPGATPPAQVLPLPQLPLLTEVNTVCENAGRAKKKAKTSRLNLGKK
jgi:hypothetical protein